MKRISCFKRLFFISFLILAMGCLFAFSAVAAPQNGPAGMAFYTAPTTTGTHGTLIRYRTSTSVPPGGPSCYSWTIMYYSQDANNQSNVVTGTVLVPKSSYSGTRPIISYAVGTHGLDQEWAPSIQLENGTDYENSNINAVLNKGYAVLITDNPGYTNGSIPTYMAGIAQGHAVLDIVTAALQIPGITLSSSAKVGIWGYSQGGQSAAWAGQLHPTYASSIKLAGVAAGGVPADLLTVANYLDGNNGSAFLLETCIGMNSQYPDQIKLYDRINSAGVTAISQGLTMGVFESLFKFMNTPLSLYTRNGETGSQIFAIPEIASVVNANNVGGTKIKVPVYLYHGTADEFIELDQALNLKTQYCKLGVNTSYMVFPGEHITTQFQAAPYVLSWLTDRFNGKITLGSCITLNKRPVSTANPVNGDFIFSLNKWTLTGSIHLKTLMQDVTLPSGSTFTADTNMTQDTITGSLSVPQFAPYVNVILPIQIKMAITPVQPMTGTASLDNNGILHVHGHMLVNINMTQIGELGIGIPLTLTTKTPVDFPIDFDGPVSSLGDGTLTFTGTTTFPDIVGDSIMGPLFTVLMSGPGQKFTFNVTPPAPTAW
jgi:pimeloyl-ACP methyl ester carboxylesterase